MELLAIEKAVHKNPVTVQDPDQDVIFVGTSTDIANSATLPRLPPQSAHLPLETAHAYNAVFQRLLEIRGVDSKSWQHRAIYRVNWRPLSLTIFANSFLDVLDVFSHIP